MYCVLLLFLLLVLILFVYQPILQKLLLFLSLKNKLLWIVGVGKSNAILSPNQSIEAEGDVIHAYDFPGGPS